MLSERNHARACLLIIFGWMCVAQNADYWNKQAGQSLDKAISLQRLNQNVARNIILFIGDGMGIPTATAARILEGQKLGKLGEEHILSWEKFPHVALAKTYNIDSQTSDSAGTATAYLCGAKTNRGVIGQDGRAKRSNCSSSKGSDIDSILKLAKDAGKSVGIITTTRLTHATPSAAYAHVPERNWESDADIPEEETKYGCRDIARQFVENTNIDVALAGGRKNFMDINTRDPEHHDIRYGRRKDGRNLIKEWINLKPPDSQTHYVWNKADFDKIVPEETDYLLGLFEYSSMQYESFRSKDIAGEPSIAEMTEKAIKILQKNEKGFFLLVEGARIDHGHHNGIASLALYDAIAMAEAVTMATNLVSLDDTLMIVTADHSHTMTIGGYPSRGNPILGTVDTDNALDGLPYTTLAYANGPGGIITWAGFKVLGRRLDPGNITESKVYVQQALVPRITESHGGEDVSIYANGPMAHLLHGVHEQNYIMHVMKYAACLGNITDHCNGRSDVTTFDKYTGAIGGSTSSHESSILVIICCYISVMFKRTLFQ